MNVFIAAHQEILELMLKHEVEFMLIGGYAVIYYGYMRTTGDMDLWLKPTNDNKFNMCKVFDEAGYEAQDIMALENLNFEKKIVFSIGSLVHKIDFHTHIDFIQYHEAEKNKVIAIIDEMKLPIIHLNDLILSKMNTDRLKDKADIEELQRINQLKPSH